MSRVPLVSDASAILSMRESDFDAYSAMGEVIDNSLQAAAKSIKISFDRTEGGKELVKSVAFGDDGTGMSAEILHRCLQLGYSTRYDDRSGIGRFGVGATLGAINQCKRIEVYSRMAGSDWLYTYVDLDEVTAGDEDAGIPTPTSKKPSEALAALAGTASGTVVIWSKYDRQPEKGSKMHQELEIWIGRTYRKFIWEGVNIVLNGVQVNAIDPLYVRTEKTKHPNDPKAYEFTEMSFEWPIPEADKKENGKHAAPVRIRFSLLPQAFRPTQGSGSSTEARERYIDRNNGISILRNDREVHYGDIPHWPKGFKGIEEIDRWWGCEVSFGAELDRAFTVKNIKRGAIPERDLKETIAEKISGVRSTALEEVRKVWKEKKAADIGANLVDGTDTGHSEAEHVGKLTKVSKNQIDLGKDIDAEAKRIALEMELASEEETIKWQAKFKSQPFTIQDTQWKGPEFVETIHLGGTDVLKYNMQHAFFAEIADIRAKLKSGDGVEEQASRLKILIDLLLMSYSKAEANFQADEELKAETFVAQLRMTWGNFLRSYIQTWKKDSEDTE
jgi:hypothetical protein